MRPPAFAAVLALLSALSRPPVRAGALGQAGISRPDQRAGARQTLAAFHGRDRHGTAERSRGRWRFFPDGNFLVTESAGDHAHRPARRRRLRAALAGVPDVKSVAAQGLHDVVLDPDFARNRMLYFTYFAPPNGEAPAIWPIEFFYERVWTKPLAERRTMQIGMERVARARLSEDNRSWKMSMFSPKAPNAASSSRATARCSSPAPTASASTIRISTASSTTSPTTPTSAATFRAASCASIATARSRKTIPG